MIRITLLLLTSLLIPDLYIYFFYIKRKWTKRRLRFLYWLPSILLTLVFLYYMGLNGPNALAHYARPIGYLAIGSLLMIIPKILFVLITVPGVCVRPHLQRWPFAWAGIVTGVVACIFIVYGATFGIRKLHIEPVTYASERLPEGFDGYRIVQISDLHVGSFFNEKLFKELVEKVNGLKPDLIVFTGDLVNQRSCEVDRFVEVLSGFSAPDGVFSILGNHDYGSYYRWDSPEEEAQDRVHMLMQQKRMGWRLLNNEHVLLHHGGDSIALIGVENDGEPPFSQYADLKKATQGADSLFAVLLSHNPTHWRRDVLPNSNIDLMLAGHTHGMQVVVMEHSLSEMKYPEWKGMYYEGSRALYVNIGIGYVGMPLRLGAWPEITLLTLKRTVK